jgi:dTMP kinase
MTGVFISFEGGDGTGKSTQIKILSERLRTAGREVVETREPGGSDGGEAIRALIVKGAKDRWSPLTEALLMYAARRDHLERTILPALERGAVVISDRFADSSMAYQGVAGGAGVDNLKALHDLVVGDHDPDLTIILDAPAEDGLRRADASKGETRFEDKGAEFQRKVRQAYLDIAKAAPERCIVVDARGSVETVAARIAEAVGQRLPAVLS